MKKSVFFVLVPFLFCPSASADERHEHDFIEPLVLHHAHNATEFKVNNVFRENIREEETDPDTGETTSLYKDVFETELEMAFASPDRRLAIEAHLPFTNEGVEADGGRILAVGDIEIEPIRYAIWNDTDSVLTFALGFVAPTGDVSQGSGEGRSFVEPHILYDRMWGDWYFGANLVPGFEMGGEEETTLGWGLAAARRFDGLPWEPAFSLEIGGESSLSGEPEGLDIIQITPGLHLNLPCEWTLRAGLRLPLTQDREEARTFLLQAGRHFD